MTPTLIVAVEVRPSGMVRITDAHGTKYATKDLWLASLAEQYMKKKTLVDIHSGAGWFYRELSGLVPVVKEQAS